MPDTRDPQSVIAAAEQAAVGGDYASAERLLREAADLQEASLGPLHPELANTLNNLGVVYEVTEKPDEAERCFRRASNIATAALPADHPFVSTSRKNLDDFLATRTPPAPPAPSSAPPATVAPATVVRPIVVPPTVVPPVVAPAIVVPAAVVPPTVVPAKVDQGTSVEPVVQRSTVDNARPATTPAAPPSIGEPTPGDDGPKMSRTIAMIAIVAVGLVVIILARGLWTRNGAPAESSPGAPITPPAASPAPIAEPNPNVPPPVVEPRGAEVKERSPKETGSKRQASPIVVVGAQLCKELVTSGNWRCDPPSNPVARGRLLFYTRLKSPTDTTVQHRWYQGERLRKSVDLRIGANPGAGYRTYSRNTVEDSGEWRVELRTRDGVLLHEERFSVR